MRARTPSVHRDTIWSRSYRQVLMGGGRHGSPYSVHSNRHEAVRGIGLMMSPLTIPSRLSPQRWPGAHVNQSIWGLNVLRLFSMLSGLC